jgi:hypothetical protein
MAEINYIEQLEGKWKEESDSLTRKTRRREGSLSVN